MKTNRKRFALPQRLLHWLMAVCILAMLFIGVSTVSTVTPKYLTLVQVHKPLGIAILVLALIRLTLRLVYRVPALLTDMPEPMKLIAELSQYIFYALMISMPLIGWGMLSTASYPVVLFGSLHLPSILPVSPGLHTLLWHAHYYLAFAFFALILFRCGASVPPAGQAGWRVSDNGARLQILQNVWNSTERVKLDLSNSLVCHSRQRSRVFFQRSRCQIPAQFDELLLHGAVVR